MEENKTKKPSQAKFIEPLKVRKSKNGNLLIYLNEKVMISLHPNYIQKILESGE